MFHTADIDWAKELTRNENWLKTVIASRLGEPLAVDDVWQEVSIAAFSQKAPINDPTKIAPWLYRIAVIQTLMYRRKVGRRRKLLERFVQRTPPENNGAHIPNPLDWTLLQERKQQVREAMQLLPERDRETLMLKYVHDWSYREMAVKLGVSVASVQSKLHRARERLRELLKL